MRSRIARFLAPFAVFAVIVGLAAIPNLTASASPNLPPLTPQQLVDKVRHANVETFSGDIRLTTNLGIPNLSSVQNSYNSGGFNPLDLLSGNHEARVRVDGPERQQLSTAGSLSEVDVYHNGRDVWTWQSDGSRVTHTILAPRNTDQHDADANDRPGATPDAAAKQLLDKLDPSTALSVDTPEYVAGRPVYELVLRPKASESTVDHAAIAVDAARGFPLRVTLAAKGHHEPAVELGYTHISYAKPSGSFSFTPPKNAKVTTNDQTQPRQRHPAAAPTRHHRRFHHPLHRRPDMTTRPAPAAAETGPSQHTVVGQDWTQVVVARGAGVPRQAMALMRGATPVSGPFGSGRLVQTRLVNVLLLDDGRIAAGFVSPSALEAAVPHA